MSDKDQVTSASAIELEEAQLDAVAGGGVFDVLKSKIADAMNGKIPSAVAKMEQNLANKLPGGATAIVGKMESVLSGLKTK